ncbi:MAG: hypothetical protein ABW148_10265 [Sedimenticola sp.]
MYNAKIIFAILIIQFPGVIHAESWINECKPGSPSINSLANASSVDFCLEQSKKRLELYKTMTEIRNFSHHFDLNNSQPIKTPKQNQSVNTKPHSPISRKSSIAKHSNTIVMKWPVLFIDKMVFEENGRGHAVLVDSKGSKYFIKNGSQIMGGKIEIFDADGIVFLKDGMKSRLPFTKDHDHLSVFSAAPAEAIIYDNGSSITIDESYIYNDSLNILEVIEQIDEL